MRVPDHNLVDNPVKQSTMTKTPRKCEGFVTVLSIYILSGFIILWFYCSKIQKKSLHQFSFSFSAFPPK